MQLARFLGWPTRDYGLDMMDYLELLDWITLMNSSADDLKSDEQVFQEQIAGFRALKEATKR